MGEMQPLLRGAGAQPAAVWAQLARHAAAQEGSCNSKGSHAAAVREKETHTRVVCDAVWETRSVPTYAVGATNKQPAGAGGASAAANVTAATHLHTQHSLALRRRSTTHGRRLCGPRQVCVGRRRKCTVGRLPARARATPRRTTHSGRQHDDVK